MKGLSSTSFSVIDPFTSFIIVASSSSLAFGNFTNLSLFDNNDKFSWKTQRIKSWTILLKFKGSIFGLLGSNAIAAFIVCFFVIANIIVISETSPAPQEPAEFFEPLNL